ncbi:MAG TPA: hypothetical protein VNJ12_02240 [Candidatus Dormibacteraeota bacterium]|nr:hypothetical protein [Candidatus Dormibacteraeota bacterium]
MKTKQVTALIGAGLLLAAISLAPKMVNAQQQKLHVVVVHDVIHVISPRLGGMKVVPPAKGVRREIPWRRTMPATSNVQPATQDPALQAALGPTGAAGSWINFLGNGVTQPNFSICCAPPDTNGAAGATQYVQWVNTEFSVFSKTTGQIVYGPAEGNTLWQPLGGACASNNSGDPVAEYDKQAQRWVMMQPVFTSPYYLCVAVSTTSDATGTYNLYQFPIPSNYFPDYPKLAVWPDAYYVSYNNFSGNNFVGGSACALDRSSLLQGNSATMQCFLTSYPSLLPSDLDGDSGAPGTTAAPPAGSPDYFMDFTTTNALNLFGFHVDWSNPANSTFTGPTVLPVASFSEACGGGTCIPQPGTSQQLDSLGDRLMYRLAYRNFGSYESMVVSQSVDTGNGNTGVRWYEIRNPGTSPTVYQQGTFAPDSDYRWMPSIAEDHLGDIAMGYSVSSGTTYPSIRYTGRVPSDPLGTMETESSLFAGTASQVGGSNLTRWGDYSGMSVDPSNDCTFWYTNEYLPYNGAFNWDTQVGSFSIPTCAAPPPADFSLTGAPMAKTVTAGSGATYLVGVDPVGGYTGNVTLSVTSPNPLPAGMSVYISPNPVDVVAASSVNTDLTLFTTTATPAGTYNVTVSGTDGTNTNAVPITIVVQAAPTPDFSLSASPSSQTIAGIYGSYTIDVTPANGYTGNVTLSVPSTLPAGMTATFAPNPASVTGNTAVSSSLTVGITTATPAGTYNLTVSGTDGTLTHTTQVTAIVPPPDFSLTGVGSQTISAGSSAIYVISILPTGNYGGSVTMSVSSPSPLPTGMMASFVPNPITVNPTQSNDVTLTLNTTTSTPAATYNLTVTATDGTLTHTTTGTLVVQAPPPPSFAVYSVTGSEGVFAGSSVSSTINVTPSNGYTGTVTLSVPLPNPLPAGMTLGFAPNPITISSTSPVSSTLTVTTTASTPAGSYNLTVSGTDGTRTSTSTISVTVQAAVSSDFTISATPSTAAAAPGSSTSYAVTVGGSGTGPFNGTVNLSVAGVPSRTGTTWSTTSITGSGSATLTLSPNRKARQGTYSLTITGTSGSLSHSVAVTFVIGTISTPDFSLSATPSSVTVAPGSVANYSLSISGSGGFTGNVGLTETGLPSGATPTFTPVTVTGGSGSSALGVATSTGLAVGTYPFTVTGTSGSLVHSASLTLVVQQAGTGGNFSISISPSSQSVGPKSSTSYTVTVTALNGFTGSVNLSVTGLPSRTNSSFSSSTITGSGTSTLTISTTPKSSAGSYSLTVTGTSGSLTQTAQATLNIT